MKSFYFIIVTKIVTFIGATLNSIGFLTFILFDSLREHRWELIGGGTALMIFSELIGYFSAQKMLKNLNHKLNDLNHSTGESEMTENQNDDYAEYNCFYCNYARGEEVPSSNPSPLFIADVFECAESVLMEPKDFFGITDSEGVTVQFMVEENEEVLIEIPMPTEQGSYGKQISLSEIRPLLESLLKDLPDEFDIEQILNLKFTAW